MFDFVQVVQPGSLLRRLLELQLSNPGQVSLRPRRHGRRGPPAMPQQKLAQAVACTKLVLLCRFSGAHQVAQRLVRSVRHPYRREITGAIAPSQLARIAPVRLDAIPGLHRHQRRRDDLAVHSRRSASRTLPRRCREILLR
jgi:hypothetical protein